MPYPQARRGRRSRWRSAAVAVSIPESPTTTAAALAALAAASTTAPVCSRAGGRATAASGIPRAGAAALRAASIRIPAPSAVRARTARRIPAASIHAISSTDVLVGSAGARPTTVCPRCPTGRASCASAAGSTSGPTGRASGASAAGSTSGPTGRASGASAGAPACSASGASGTSTLTVRPAAACTRGAAAATPTGRCERQLRTPQLHVRQLEWRAERVLLQDVQGRSAVRRSRTRHNWWWLCSSDVCIPARIDRPLCAPRLSVRQLQRATDRVLLQGLRPRNAVHVPEACGAREPNDDPDEPTNECAASSTPRPKVPGPRSTLHEHVVRWQRCLPSCCRHHGNPSAWAHRTRILDLCWQSVANEVRR
jgi:hypothetical protein